ncbi:hypothetical protein MUB18_06335 [Sphingobacterium sp. PCS056]|uniref:hypothetical protein n=1 Tax=Sphingobacterium TaxID=28453 RepID=UPI00200CB002|nr:MULTISPECIES: hypothetical protein [Sphingobacterium]UPZ37914.1 hypothetical protein MUB18_06335 [Sphingobacterium sp. PCS056]UXD69433.1 hypothetical protein MUK51_19930 [Sphingobacterium faecium]
MDIPLPYQLPTGLGYHEWHPARKKLLIPSFHPDIPVSKLMAKKLIIYAKLTNLKASA